MSVTPDDIARVAQLARLRVSDADLPRLAVELDGILGHLEALARIPDHTIGAIDPSMPNEAPLRADHARDGSEQSIDIAALAPLARDEFFLVPRLSTHESPGP